MLQKLILPLVSTLAFCLTAISPRPVSAVSVMNYGADGNDYFQFTTPSMAFDKASGFTTLITFAMHVNADGTLVIGGVACTNGIYVGPTNWGSFVTTLKTPPTTVSRYEVCVGGYGDTSYANIESLVAAQGTGPTSILYKNFQALKNAVPGIDAINDDDEQTYDLNSSTSFANMLGGLGYKFTMVPYQNQSFWVNLKNSVTNCDYIYLQCYEGGAGNDPGQWDTAFGNGVVVIPGQESNTATTTNWHNWYLETGVQGGFYYPDVIFNSTYWSAAIIEGNGALPTAPMGLVATHGENQVVLSWNTVPGAISYNVKRSTISGGETTITNVSTANNNWPVSNQYTDNGLTTGKTYYYKVSAVNANGESINSMEVSATPPAAATWTGLGSDNNWGTGGNWNSAPNFPTGVTFAGSTRLANSNNLAGITLDNLTFDAAAGSFVLGGNGITLSGNMSFNGNPVAPVTQTVNLNMIWSLAALDVDTPSDGNLVIGGGITSSADYSLNKTDAGTLTLGGTNSVAGMGINGGTNIITGYTTINGNGDGNDRLYLGDGDFLNGCNGTLVIQPGAALTVTGSFGDTFVIGRDSGSGTVIQNGGIFTFNPANNQVMLLCATGDTRTRAAYDMNGGLLDMRGNTLTVGWGATLVTGIVNQASGIITNLGSFVIPQTSGANGLGVYTLSGGSIYIGASGITTAGGSSRYAINLGGGTVGAYQSWASSLNMNLTNLNGSVTFDTMANTITLLGTLSGSGSLIKVGSGTLTLGGINTIEGLDVDGGTNTITGNTTINGNSGGGNYDRLYVGDGDSYAGCNGALDIQPGGALNVNGNFNDTFVIGRDGGSGMVNQNGGTFSFNPANNGTIWLGAANNSATRSAYNMNGGLLNMNGNTLGIGLGSGVLITGLVNQVSGVITNVGNLWVGWGNGYGVYNLTGGSIYIGSSGITTSSGNYTVNLGSGTVGAETSWASSLNMNLTGSNGPVTFNPAGNTITLSGVLSGNGGLTVTGGGTLDLSGANTYTGNTTVNTGSTLELTQTGSSPGTIYLSNGANLNLNFSGDYIAARLYTNNVAVSNGLYTASSLPGFVSGSGSLQVVGATSTGLWTGGGVDNNWSTGSNWDHNVVPIFPIGLTFAGSTRLTNNNNLSSINANSITFDAAAGTFMLNGNGIMLSGAIGFNGNPAMPVTQTVNLNMALSASQSIDTPLNGNLLIGGALTSENDLTKLDAGTLILGGTNMIETLDIDGGTNTITGNTTISGNSGDGNYDRFYVGDGDSYAGCNGTLVIQPGAVLNVTGNFNDTFVIGRDGGSGTVIQNGGTFIFNPANISLMLVCATSEAGTTAAYNMNGGLLNMSGNTLGAGYAVASVVTTGMVNQVGGVITNLNALELGLQQSGGLGIYTLSGGSIYIGAGGITTAGGNYNINLGGGTVGAYQSWTSSLGINLTGSNGPVTFDTGANTITLSGLLYGTGGLTKVGSGTLMLSGGASYLGSTVVKAGTLELNPVGSNPGVFYISNGASLNVNAGETYTVDALYTNNVAVSNGVYTSNTLPGFITGSGSLQVVNLEISYNLSGKNLTLSWPTNYLGWILQEQTNSLNVGLNANWINLSGSASVTTTNMLISPANPTVFYRLAPPLPPSVPPLTRQMFITNNLLNLPVSNNGPSRRVTITVGGVPVRDFDINLADGAPDWWAFVDVSAFQGQTATITVNNLAVGSTGLSSIVQSNGIVGATNLYSETLRPQVHYSSKRGLINDVNGMIYYNGQYNLYYQHNPYDLNFSANGAERNWGHAVSPDMVHWQELPEAIYPHSYGDWVWSGSAVIDTANTGGFKTGTNDVIVASYYSTARGQCIAYSNDGGLTFTDYTNNPVVNVTGRDPHMLWYAPSNYWVMAVYDSNLGGIDFFTTPDFHTWTYRSGIAGFAECPDIFELPVDGNTNNMLWEINGGNAAYMLGNFNGAVFTPTTALLPGNVGSGFYASQTFTVMPLGDTRRVRMGWAQVNMPGMPFTGMHFFPTVLTLQTLPAGVRLCSAPVAEITNAIQNTYSWTNLTLNPGSNPLSGISGQLFDVQAQFTPGSASTLTFNLCGVPVTYAPASQQISCNGITNSLAPVNGTITLEMITDCQSVEIFGNAGQLYMPIVTTPYSPTNNGLSLASQGASTFFNSLMVNQLQSIWPLSGN
jgi:fructan beta-fructosidase